MLPKDDAGDNVMPAHDMDTKVHIDDVHRTPESINVGTSDDH